MASQGLQQVQKQAQTLILAPQLRQSLKILQVSTLELRNVILEELQANPALEELPMDGISIEAPTASADSDNEDADAPDTIDSPENRPERDQLDPERDELHLGENYSALQRLNEDLRELYAEENASHSWTSDDEERRQHFFDSLTTETSLQEHLIRQAQLGEASQEVMAAIEYLVGSLDDSGFLPTPLSDLSLMSGLPLKDLQEAHRVLKTLEPSGIGAANIQECLLIQLAANNQSKSLAATIIRDYYPLLLRRRIPDIARKLSISTDEVQDVLEEIAALDPAPGRKFADDNNRVVIPDVYVERDDSGEWLITLNNDYIPRLRLSTTYKEMLAKGKLTPKERDYIQEKFRSGKFLINSIEQRQQTIERITRALLRFQQGFFEEGVAKLRPLTMNTVAQDVGVHETTVSRAIANKFISTPHGLFEFKYFFTPGYTSQEGQSVSNTTVKDNIAHIIAEENPAHPLSDQEVVGILGERGIKIARRTVAKYREELGILPTHLRRRYD